MSITDACINDLLQMRLAELLEEEGADIIQTEGGKFSSPTKPGVLGLIEKVEKHPVLARSFIIFVFCTR
jgi:hypothetical protein